MFDWSEIKKWFSKETSSKDVARDRLKLVLVHDRTCLSSELIEELKNEILIVISKYIEINQEEFDIHLSKNQEGDGNSMVHALVANIPIKSMKRIVHK
ncbi:MAG: cell division topological specificity factor MinE [Hyphomonadaceae bacterium]|nr:cell division topological specificity factor MinE [Clostridia bacterium]